MVFVRCAWSNCAIVAAAFGDEGNGDKEDESIRQQAEKYRDANYDWSEVREEEEAFVAERSVGIEECLRGLFDFRWETVSQNDRQALVSFIRKAILEPKGNAEPVEMLHMQGMAFAGEEWQKIFQNYT